VYQTMKITALSRMIPFFDLNVVEKLSVDAMKYNFLQLKIDHLKGIVRFGSQVRRVWEGKGKLLSCEIDFLVFIILNTKLSLSLF